MIIIMALLIYIVTEKLILILVVPYILTNEKKSNMEYLLKTTKRGYRQLIKIKVVAGTIIVIATSILYQGISLSVFQLLTKCEGWSLPLYSVAGYEYATLNMSIIRFVILQYFISVLV